MQAIRLKDLKQDRYFTLRPIDKPKNSQVLVKGEYDEISKKYHCSKWTNILGKTRLIDGETIVFIEFYF